FPPAGCARRRLQREAMMAKKKGWSYSAGDRGKSRVRVYEDARDGKLYAEWHEEADGRRKRQRLSLSRFGIVSRAAAVEKAESMAAAFGGLELATPTGPIPLGRLLDLYDKEVMPTKSYHAQRNDRLRARIARLYFGADALPQSLGRERYNAFLRDRKAGRVPGVRNPGPVGDQTVLADVVFLHSVFNWATVERPDGTVLLQRNPWRGFPRPRPKNPRRPVMTEELHNLLIEHSPDWRHALAMELCRETCRRLGAVRQLRWSDIDLDARTVRWRGEHDKVRKEAVTPLSDRAVRALRAAPRGIGEAPVFPALRNPTRPVRRELMTEWMLKAKKTAGIEIRQLGYHSEKRAAVRDPAFRQLPAALQEALSGTTHAMLRRVYDLVDLEAMREAVQELDRKRA
ncbi:MAG TPA: tyrosine-type recombinase/integrase, partial [Longimicrobiaceae bacterium]|nr:tyrosine-type recombinase/integrase [Longimicrobiaceae bacterium]